MTGLGALGSIWPFSVPLVSLPTTNPTNHKTLELAIRLYFGPYKSACPPRPGGLRQCFQNNHSVLPSAALPPMKVHVYAVFNVHPSSIVYFWSTAIKKKKHVGKKRKIVCLCCQPHRTTIFMLKTRQYRPTQMLTTNLRLRQE